MRCEEFRDLLDDYLAEELDGPRRAEWRRHLEACADCRAHAASAEPTLLFAVAPPPVTDQAAVESCVAQVAAEIRHARLERELRPRRGRWLAAAAAVVVLLTGGLGWRLLEPRSGAVDGSGGPAVVEAADESSAPPEVQVDMKGDGVRIYHFANDTDDDTVVAFVVNPALES